MPDPIANPDPGLPAAAAAEFIAPPAATDTEPGLDACVEIILCCKNRNGICLLVDEKPVVMQFERTKKGIRSRSQRAILCPNCGAYLLDQEIRKALYERGYDAAIDENIDAMLLEKGRNSNEKS